MVNRLEGDQGGRWKTSYQVRGKDGPMECEGLQRHLAGIWRSDLPKINGQKHQNCILNQGWATPPFHQGYKSSGAKTWGSDTVWGFSGKPWAQSHTLPHLQCGPGSCWGNGTEAPSICPLLHRFKSTAAQIQNRTFLGLAAK